MKIDIVTVKMVKEKTFEYNGRKDNLRCVDDLVELCRAIGYDSFAEEVVGLVATNNAGDITHYSEVSRGALDFSVVSPREVFKRVVLANAASFFLVHNHTSGKPEPSSEDIGVTRRMAEAANLMGIRFSDHVIIAGDGYFSFKEDGYLE